MRRVPGAWLALAAFVALGAWFFSKGFLEEPPEEWILDGGSMRSEDWNKEERAWFAAGLLALLFVSVAATTWLGAGTFARVLLWRRGRTKRRMDPDDSARTGEG